MSVLCTYIYRAIQNIPEIFKFVQYFIAVQSLVGYTFFEKPGWLAKFIYYIL